MPVDADLLLDLDWIRLELACTAVPPVSTCGTGHLKVGERTALQRMPLVAIKERKVVRAAKAPVRATGLAVVLVRSAIRGVGHSVKKIIEMGWLGDRVEWVPEADVLDGKNVGWKQKERARVER
ncbi:hypothetical protein LTR96_011611 [Exophiala xenobiotica]|nr:hypothetical protein LTR72_011908 [Exophiala xenobiotica]KAK5262937.1 hypothetical protein LTR96_011611 [Exophiala xenobiotica]KAK5283631.1 hypothetical protein LTR14_011847 [Exophiala xenobiotica]KAK5332269.1 hypothetical protein LTR98_011597 [Exophiala xenobiotica]KAK5466161.1 hypothetical protein LTR55_011724 [Exophiala xenobiotica]